MNIVQTFPQSHAAIIPRRSKNSASDIPIHPPNLSALVVKVCRVADIKLRTSIWISAAKIPKFLNWHY